jgi:hypothetical protein
MRRAIPLVLALMGTALGAPGRGAGPDDADSLPCEGPQAPDDGAAPQAAVPTTWGGFYRQAAQQYEVRRTTDDRSLPLKDRAVFDWSSINNYHGAVFAWTDNGRPIMLATVFSFPLQDSKQRLAVHEFASFAEGEVVVIAPGGVRWAPPAPAEARRAPKAPAPSPNASVLKLQCRQLAKAFSADMNRRGERWDLRLLPTPLVEYQEASPDVLGGGLFAFVGYSTDPEILLLLEARKSPEFPAWHFQPVRFSDKSLYLRFKGQLVWQSLRTAHGGDGPDTEDPLYRVMVSERLAPDVVEKLSAESKD